MRKFTLIVMLFLLIFVLAACNNSADTRTNETQLTPPAEEEELRTFTLEELSIYDGLEDRDAYVAVNGYVYDVTNSSQWPNGLHRGQHQAGQDLSDAINTSPHGMSALNNVPRIGKLVESGD